MNILNGFFHSFFIGYSLKTVLKLLGVLFSLKKLKKNPLLLFFAIFSKESFSFGLFPGLYSSISKIVLCSLRNITKTEKPYYAFISGFIAGWLSLMSRPKEWRSIWGVFLLARAFDACYNKMIMKGYFKKSQFHYVMFFVLLKTFNGYNYASEAVNNDASYNKFCN